MPELKHFYSEKDPALSVRRRNGEVRKNALPGMGAIQSTTKRVA